MWNVDAGMESEWMESVNMDVAWVEKFSEKFPQSTEESSSNKTLIRNVLNK
jgi:hypothetical protein